MPTLIPAGHRERVAARVLARRLFNAPKADAVYDWMREPGVHTAVLVEPGADPRAILGFVTWGEHTIYGLAVDPGRRREGLARQLMAHAMAPPRSMSLQVGRDNTPAQRLYRALGFLPPDDPSEDDVYADGTPFLRMFCPDPSSEI